jgi:hypothetical protein
MPLGNTKSNARPSAGGPSESAAERPVPQAIRPELPAEAIQRITDAEDTAIRELQKNCAQYLPGHPKFVLNPVEINAGCWKLIEHLLAFATALFNAQARELYAFNPQAVRMTTL